ncbi:MAG: hypothetical protein ACD_5C00121G0002 [uncultured bacterium]|nr:MAG: hypothetical protein ACD_5C00121G0002 [uncultured bacterium]
MFQGYKTWIGLVLTVLGTAGVFEKTGVSQEEVSQIIDVLVQLSGLVITAYGNYDAHKRLKEIQ